MTDLTYKKLARASGISTAMAHMIISGERRPSLELALRIYDATGARFGPLERLTKREVAVARKMASNDALS